MKITNKFNLIEPVVEALTFDDYTRGDSNRSITQLIDSPRQRILRKELDDKVVIDVSELVGLAIGRAMHILMGGHAHGKFLPEERVAIDIGGWSISGAIDVQKITGKNKVALFDYKSTSVWSVIYGKQEWHNQLNSYATLVEKAKGVEVTGLSAIPFLKDWRQSDLLSRGKDYPRASILPIEIPLWPAKKREEYLAGRVALHQEAEYARLTGGTLPPCTDEERWMTPTTYAVIKKGNKRAKRVLPCYTDAEDFIKDNELKGFEIIERIGLPNRCAKGWCKIAAWCDQYQDELKRGDKI